jgi:hypothetical protein
MRVAPLAAAVIAAGCAASADGQTVTTQEAARLTAAAKSNIAAKLKDPASAQFRSLFLSAKEIESGGKTYTMHTLCGELNAKNSFGGYQGFRRFAASPSTPSGHIDAADDPSASAAFDSIVWAQLCANKVREVR